MSKKTWKQPEQPKPKAVEPESAKAAPVAVPEPVKPVAAKAPKAKSLASVPWDNKNPMRLMDGQPDKLRV